MGVKDIMKKLGKTSEVTGQASRRSKGLFFNKIDRNDAKNIAELATGVRMTKAGVGVGIAGIGAYTVGSSIYSANRRFDKGEIVGGTVANTMNTLNQGITSPSLNADIDRAVQDPYFNEAYTSENFNISNRDVGADMVFAMHYLR